MRLEMVRVERGEFDMELLLAAVGLALLLGAVCLRYVPRERRIFRRCTFKAVTGRPCLTCGGTRAAEHLARLEPGAAFRWNPLVAAMLLLAGPYGVWVLAARLFELRRPRLRLSSAKDKWILAAVIACLLAGNWAYLIAAGV